MPSWAGPSGTLQELRRTSTPRSKRESAEAAPGRGPRDPLEAERRTNAALEQALALAMRQLMPAASGGLIGDGLADVGGIAPPSPTRRSVPAGGTGSGRSPIAHRLASNQ